MRHLYRRFSRSSESDVRAISRMYRSLDDEGQPHAMPMLNDADTGKPTRVPAGEELHCCPYGWNEYTTFCADFLNSTAMDSTQFILEVWLD